MDLGGSVGGHVAGDDVHRGARSGPFGDVAGEGGELRRPAPLHRPPDHLSGGDVQGRQQAGRAVAPAAARPGPRMPRLHREGPLGPPRRLDPRLSVDRQHDGVVRRVDIQAHDVADPGPGPGVARDPGRPHLVRPEPVAPQDAVHVRGGQLQPPRQRPQCPVPGARRRRDREAGHGPHRSFRGRLQSRRAGRVPQRPVHALPGEAVPPALHGRPALSGPPHGLRRAAPPTRGRGWSGRARRASGCSAGPSRSVRGACGRRPKAWFPAHCLACFFMVVTEPPDGDWKAVARFTDKCRHLSSVNH